MNTTGKKIKAPVKKGVAKVPVIMQMEALECGAACLTMVLAYYDKWIPLEKVRVDCGVSRDGSNAGNVLKAARFYGLEADGYKLEPQMLVDNAYFPCIIHWNFNHFVVLDGFRGNKAILVRKAKERALFCRQTAPGSGSCHYICRSDHRYFFSLRGYCPRIYTGVHGQAPYGKEPGLGFPLPCASLCFHSDPDRGCLD